MPAPKIPDFAPVETMTYNEAVAQLEQILRQMQGDQCDIDLLAAYTRRAAELLRSCRERLTATDAELQAILADIETR